MHFGWAKIIECLPPALRCAPRAWWRYYKSISKYIKVSVDWEVLGYITKYKDFVTLRCTSQSASVSRDSSVARFSSALGRQRMGLGPCGQWLDPKECYGDKAVEINHWSHLRQREMLWRLSKYVARSFEDGKHACFILRSWVPDVDKDERMSCLFLGLVDPTNLQHIGAIPRLNEGATGYGPMAKSDTWTMG